MPSSDDSIDLQASVQAFIFNIVSTLPANSDYIAKLCAAQAQGEILSQVTHYCKVGWPEKYMKGPLKIYK